MKTKQFIFSPPSAASEGEARDDIFLAFTEMITEKKGETRAVKNNITK